MQEIDGEKSEIEQLRLKNSNLNKRLKEIEESEVRYRLLFKTIPIGVVYQSKNGEIIIANHAAEQILGMSIDQMQGRTSMDPRWKAVHEDFSDFPGETHPSMIALKTGKSVKNEIMGVFNPVDNIYHWININAIPQFLSGENEPYMVYTSFEDITERKKTAQNLQKERNTAQNYLDIAGVIFVALDKNGIVTLINDKGCEILGYTEEEIIGKNWFENFIPEDLREQVIPVAKQLLAGEIEAAEYFENPVLTKKGEIRLIAWHNTLLKDDEGVIVGHLSSGDDITERKEIEQELQKSEEHYRNLVEKSPDILYVYSNKTGTVYWSERVEDILGYTQDHLLNNPTIWYDSIHLEDLSMVDEAIEKSFQGTFFDIEYRIKTRGGNWCWLHDRSILFTINEDELLIEGIATDITDRKISESKLQESEERYRLLVEKMSDGLGVKDKNGKITFINDKFCEMLGYNHNDLIGTQIIDLFTEIGRLNFEKQMLLRAKGKSTPYEAELIKKSGDLLSVLISPSPIFDSKGDLLYSILVITDVTERKKREDEFYKNQKIESIGLLAGGIAHDFNNILTSVIGNISLAKLSFEENDDNYSYLLDAEKGASSAKELTRQLLTFSKGGAPIKELLSLNDIIRDSAKFTLHGQSAGIEFDIQPGLFPVYADKSQIGQVIQNLILNSIQAMEKGLITIKAKNIELELGNKYNLKPKEYVEIAVLDTGCGIDEKLLPYVFDLYFTTKSNQTDAGSGIGLAVCYSIIKKHEGIILAESEINEGSKFTFYLPAQPDELLSIVENKSLSLLKPKRVHQGKVLVLEDEKSVMKVIGTMLEKFNFQTTLTSEGLETISRYKKAFKTKEAFSLVILDLTIPGGMGGEEVMKKLIDFDPNVRAIVSSGYSTGEIMSNYEKFGFKGVLVKPYTISELKEVLRIVSISGIQ